MSALRAVIEFHEYEKDPRQAASLATAVLASWMGCPMDKEGA